MASQHRSESVCHLANIANKTGRTLKWSPAEEQFIGEDKANKLLDRPRRKPRELPKVSLSGNRTNAP
jgi:hypothetical protein